MSMTFEQLGKDRKMNKARANAVYDILVQECGASEKERDSFVFHQTNPKEECIEWRFCGKLGFGGKFWRNAGRIYVNCYSEDMTPEKHEMIWAANRRLAAL